LGLDTDDVGSVEPIEALERVENTIKKIRNGKGTNKRKVSYKKDNNGG
jgi:hypothetical protein